MTLRSLRNDFKPDILFPSITAGLIAGIVTISLEISLAALIFSGDLDQFLAGGIGLMLFGAFASRRGRLRYFPGLSPHKPEMLP